MKKEKVLEGELKGTAKQAKVAGRRLDLSFVESHETSPGIPDVNYNAEGVEGWLELKAAPDIEVRTTQVAWFRNRIKAGGYPLILVKHSDVFMIVPGTQIAALRDDPSRENTLRLATRVWPGAIPVDQLMEVLTHPRGEYERQN